MADPISSVPPAAEATGAAGPDPLLGRTLGDFLVLEKLGQGGLAAVYRVQQTLLGREAVVKVLRPDGRQSPDVTQRFLRESRLASQLDHPYAAHIYAFGAEPDGLLWIAMELVRGTTLEEMLKAQGPLPLPRLSQLVDLLAEVVHSAHEQGVVHRDIKPSNVMVVARAGRLVPKLLDFGLAQFTLEDDGPAPALPAPPPRKTVTLEALPVRDEPEPPRTPRAEVIYFRDTRPRRAPKGDADKATRELPNLAMTAEPPAGQPGAPTQRRLTPTDRAIGTPQYMAPEHWLGGPVDARSDVYALGVLSFECLTGRLPFSGASLEDLRDKHLSAPVPSLGISFSNLLHAVLSKALAKRPEERYGSALEFASDLRLAAGLAEEPPLLPQLEPSIREALVLRGPQPLAESLSALEAARSEGAAAGAVGKLLEAIAQLLGVLALAARARVGPPGGGDAPAVVEALRGLRTGGLTRPAWVELARELCRPFSLKRDAHPIPELVSFFFPVPADVPGPDLDRLTALDRELLTVPTESGELKPWLKRLLPELSRLLSALSFLADYPLVVMQRGAAEEWVGLRKAYRGSLRLKAPLGEGEPALVTRDGIPCLSLFPLAQALPPMPGAAEELFLFAGSGRWGARLTSAPLGFERFDPSFWRWFSRSFSPPDASPSGRAQESAAPYRGLEPFSQTDAAGYFGREREAEAFANRLRRETFLAVLGPSGVGKSSFVQAGVLPLLPPGWQAQVMRPGPSPLATLAARLSGPGADASELRERLTADPRRLGDALRSRLGERTGLVLVVDQFEELLTLCRSVREREVFAAALAHAATPDDNIRVVVTLRDDFLARAQRLAPLREVMSHGLFVLGTPTPEQLVRVLVEPARQRGYQLEDGLAETMAAEVQEHPGALAVLSFTAARLWELKDAERKQMTHEAYHTLGGVGGALAQHAEATLEAMSPAAQRLAREAFRHLVSADGTRAVLNRAELLQLLGTGPAAAQVLDALIHSRLLVCSEGSAGEDRIEVVHEALLASWPRLVQWQTVDRENARMRANLKAAAQQWKDRRRDRGLLWRGGALAEYRLWRSRYDGALTPTEEAFGRASAKEAARGRRLLQVVVGLSFATLGALALGLLKANHESREHLRKLHLEQGREALLEGKPLRALVYLAQAYQEQVRTPALMYMLGNSLGMVRVMNASLNGHAGPLTSSTFSPDGTRVATSSEDGTARIWDSGTGRLLLTLVGHKGEVRSIAFSPDGARVVTSGVDQTARIWDARSGAQQITLRGHGAPLWDARFSPDGRLVATASDDRTARLWDAQSGAWLKTLDHHTGYLGRVTFSPDGREVITSSGPWEFDGVPDPKVWDVATGRLIATLSGHTLQVNAVAFSPDGRLLATAGADRSIRLWSTTRWTLARTLSGHRASIQALAFSPDGRLLASGGHDQTVQLWDPVSGELQQTLAAAGGTVRALAYSPDGAELCSVGDEGSARLWELRSGRVALTFVGHARTVRSVAYSPDGSQVLTSGYDPSAKLWNPRASSRRVQVASHGLVKWARFSRDGQLYLTSRDDEHLVAWDARTGEKRGEWAFPGGAVSALAVSPDLTWVATQSEGDDHAIKLYALPEGTLMRTLKGHQGALVSLATSQDGHSLVSASEDGTARIWDVATGTERLKLPHDASVSSGIFSHTGERILTGDAEGRVRLWDARSGALVRTLKGHMSSVDALDFSPDDRLALTAGGDQAILLWDLQSGQRLATLDGHGGPVNTVFFSPDAEMAISASHDGTVKIWGLSPHALVEDIDLDEPVAGASFSPDGRRVGVSGYRGTLSFWEVQKPPPPDELERALRCRVPFVLVGDQLVPATPDPARCDPPRG